MVPAALALLLALAAPRPFAIEVVDDETGRGVPLVELRTVNEIRLVTDSHGIAAFDEPGLMGQSVFFHVKSHGYEFPKDGLGFRGKALKVVEGGREQLKIRRINLAERLYRVTGAGIYRDSLLVGGSAPIRRPLLNAQVLGSDSVLTAVYRGKLHWFWGDTNRPSYPLGNFGTTGATSALPADGGLDPGAGVDLDYIAGDDGFARPVAPVPGPGPTWLDGLVVLKDRAGRERMFAAYAKIRPPLETYERGLVEFDPDARRFERVATFPLDAPAYPVGHPFLHADAGVEYVYFADPFPLVRVRADPEALADPRRYESFTCLAPGGTPDRPEFDRDADGAPRHSWKAGARALGPQEEAKLIRAGRLRAEDALFPLRDAATGRPVTAHKGSTYWNEYRGRWAAIFVEIGGSSSHLGEVWYAEADAPAGPWAYARKVATHEKYSFYSPKQHPQFARDGGRFLYFEGTYATTFSGNPDPTPRYDYNQVMHRLDLADPRLALPVPVYRREGGVGLVPGPRPAGSRVAFFAPDRPAPGTVPVFEAEDGESPRLVLAAPGAGPPLFFALPADAPGPPPTAVPLHEFVGPAGTPRAYSTEPSWPAPGYRRADRPACLVWRAPARPAAARD